MENSNQLWKPSKAVRSQISRGEKKDREARKARAAEVELEVAIRHGKSLREEQ